MTENKREASATRPILSRAIFKQIPIELPTMKAQITFWSLAAAGLALDLWTKKAVFDWLRHSGSYAVIDGFVQLVTALNDGAAFGIFAGRLYMLKAVSIIALIVILVIFYLSGNRQVLVNIALGLLTAGICGNLYDRFFNGGSVRDFIDVSYRNYHWPAFNVADSFLCIGVGLLVVSTFFTQQSCQKHAQQQK
jgi:signal peptidase II